MVKVNITFEKPKKRKSFDDIIISIFNKEFEFKQNVKFAFHELYQYTRDNSSVTFDFLLISVVIYNVDRLISRHHFSLEGWTREIQIENMPVMNLQKFKDIKNDILNCLNFLTGDLWEIDFVQLKDLYYFTDENNQMKINDYNFNKVCLFSGGMDSLIGVIDLLEASERIILSSHYDFGNEKKDQNELIPLLNQKYKNQFKHFQIKVGLGKKGDKIVNETTFRSRSLLFIAQGVYLAHNLNELTELIIPENGTISLNIPLTASRRSSCSTRTTHPHFIKMLNNLLLKLSVKNQVRNPYVFLTKGEMIKECKNSELLIKIQSKSTSCAKRGHIKYWDNPINKYGDKKKHCGMCMPCFYRRAALFYNDLDDNIQDNFGTNIFTSDFFDIDNIKQKRSNDLRALCDFIKNRFTKKEIEKQLIINGFSNIEQIDNYVKLTLRSYKQVEEWLRHKKTKSIINRL